MSVFRRYYRKPTAVQEADADAIKFDAERLYNTFQLVADRSDPRAMAIAKTKLEEVVMWAVKAVTS